MNRLPGALVIIDVRRERNAVEEARKLGIPTICLIDTDSDPDFADVPIPGNDDAMRAIEVILVHLADAVEVGLRGRRETPKDEEPKDEPPRRSARTTTTRAADGAVAAPAEGVVAVSEAPDAAAVADSALAPAAATTEPETPAPT